MQIDFKALSSSERYHLMTQTVIPRPIAWVLTESSEANYNLAPFSYFTAVSSQPPLMMFSIGKKPTGERKDTVVNLERQQRCVVHIASAELAPSVSATAETLDHGESEVSKNAIELNTLTDFPLPRVAGAPIAFGCRLQQIIEMGDTPQSLVFVEIESVYISDSVACNVDGRVKVDAALLQPLMRLGGQEYAHLGEVFSVSRPK
ncbi:flavin reductase family protein [Vibrio sp. WXL103]|uniref:flavin reductase family protein n=1 Tax=unclassified Vibrio TaxID=2614977 RepID=UPI003EC910DD